MSQKRLFDLNLMIFIQLVKFALQFCARRRQHSHEYWFALNLPIIISQIIFATLLPYSQHNCNFYG